MPAFPLARVAVYNEWFEDGKKVREFDEGGTAARQDAELAFWADLWAKPQGFAWYQLGLKYQVAAYVRAYIESVEADASAGLKTAVLRMETELGISIAGMRQNGWNISAPETKDTAKPPRGGKAKQTSTGAWLTGVNVAGS
ncbi:hypothetical protein [Mycetocola saprophilus]|uniref:hypothetical protein n=1 Tax=Mycetocola saprophilus TaxID=76636 RepID=UPI003BF0466D